MGQENSDILCFAQSDIFDKSKVILKPNGFSDILFAYKLPKTITLGETEYHCEAIELAARRIKLVLYPYGYNA